MLSFMLFVCFAAGATLRFTACLMSCAPTGLGCSSHVIPTWVCAIAGIYGCASKLNTAVSPADTAFTNTAVQG